MTLITKTHRRGFLGRLAGAAAALTVSGSAEFAQAQQGGPDDWIKGVKGANRALFDRSELIRGYELSSRDFH